MLENSELVPLHKKGDRTQLARYGGIQHIRRIRTVMALLITVPINAAVEGWLLGFPRGFRPMRGCGDQLHTCKRRS